MPTILKSTLPHVFSGFAVSRNKKKLFDESKTYLCDYCNQTYSVNWCIRANPRNHWICRGKYVTCPHCGKRHGKHIRYTSKNEFVPYKMDLKLTVCKTKVILQADYFAFCFLNEEFSLNDYRAREFFSFDLFKNRTQFEKFIWQNNQELSFATIEITTDSAGIILKNSALYYLNRASFAYKDTSVDKIMRKLQTTLETMLQQKQGTKVPSLWVNTAGLPDGVLVKALISFALRVKDITAPNLNRYSEFPSGCPLQFTNVPIEFPIRQVRETVRNLLDGTDEITAVTRAFALPNTAVVRNIIENKSTEAILLKRFFSIFENYDLALRAYSSYKNNRAISYMPPNQLIPPLRRLLTVYDEKTLAAFLENKFKRCPIRDTLTLTLQLSDLFFSLLYARKVRMRDLHEWLVKKYNQQTEIMLQERHNKEISQHINKPLKTPTPITEQLTMKVNDFFFSLPTESLDLLKAGQALCNCVGTYNEKIREGRCYVVLVKNSVGRVLASLEIANSEIIQAEKSHHEPLHKDIKLNQAVVEWSKRTELHIKTKAISIAA